DVNHAVRLVDVGDGHRGDDAGGIGDLHRVAIEREGEFAALHGRDLEGAARVVDHLDEVARVNVTGDDVIGQDGGQLILALGLEEALDGAGRQRLEGSVDRSKDGEGARAGQGLDEAGSLDRSDQR